MRRRRYLAVAAACATPLLAGCSDPDGGGGGGDGDGGTEGRTYGGPDREPRAALGPTADG
mgnify:CR=1 FL=1